MTFFDRIKETSTSTGTGIFTLSGAVTGYVAFTNGTYKYCIVNSTETEWEVGEGTVASGVLTRTTIEASSNAGSTVNFSAGTKYVFNTVSAAYVNSLVPYTGATSNLNLGTHGIISDYLQLSTTPTATGAVGRMIWNDTDGTLDIGMKGGNVTLQVGQEQLIRVVNKTGGTLTEAAYQAVYISGAQGQRPKVALAQGNTDETSAPTIGLVTETIANNAEGFITTSGIVRGINTTGSLQGETWVDGDLIYLSPTVAGGVTNVKPTAPNHTVYLGYVIYAHANQGKIFVKVDNGYELGELHDIYAPSPTNKQSIYWNSTNSRYELNTIAGTLGYTPANDSLVMHLAGTETAIGVKTFSIGLATTTGDNFMNTSSGNLLVGYSATPATNTYKLNVNGTTSLGGKLTIQSGTIQKFLYTDTSSGVQSFSIGTGYELYGTLHSAGGFTTYLTTSNLAGGWNIIIGSETYKSLEVNYNNVAANVDFKAKAGISNITGNGSMVTYFSSPYEGFKPTTSNGWGFGIFNSANSVMMAVKNTGQFVLSNYTTTTSFTGTVAGLLGFDSSGNIITTSSSGGGISGSGTAGQVTYWSGTSAVTGSSTLTYTPTTALLVNNSVTASGAIARGVNFTPTLTAAADNDVLVGLDIAPTFTNGSFTAVSNIALRIGGSTGLRYDNVNKRIGLGTTNNTAAFEIGLPSARFVLTNTTNSNFVEFGFPFVSGGEPSLSLLASGMTNGRVLQRQTSTKNVFIGDIDANSGGIILRTNGNDIFRAYTTANITIQNGGTFTDAGYRLDINGTGATAGALRVTGGLSLFQGGKMTIAACTTSYASLNIPSGTAPTSPSNGDMWNDGTNVYFRIGGTTKTFTLI